MRSLEVGWDFVIALEQQQGWQQWQPQQNLAASHTGEAPSCSFQCYQDHNGSGQDQNKHKHD